MAIPRSRRAGVTLIELLFALTVVLIAGVWLLMAYHSALRLSEMAQQSIVALNDLRDMAERIKTTPFTQLASDFPNGAPNGVVGPQPERYSGIIGGYTLPNEQITVTHSPNTVADPREVIVQVTWMSGGRACQRQLSTIRAGQAG